MTQQDQCPNCGSYKVTVAVNGSVVLIRILALVVGLCTFGFGLIVMLPILWLWSRSSGIELQCQNCGFKWRRKDYAHSGTDSGNVIG